MDNRYAEGLAHPNHWLEPGDRASWDASMSTNRLGLLPFN
jgi:hypothetical protein